MQKARLACVALVALVAAVLFLQTGGSTASRSIVSGSENRGLKPIITEPAAKNRVDVAKNDDGSVDNSRQISRGADTGFDAVWLANSLWIELGDRPKVANHQESILRLPVVLGRRKSIDSSESGHHPARSLIPDAGDGT